MTVGGEEYSCWGFVGALLNWEQVFLPPWRQPRGKQMVSLVNSH